jgi:hypothetical protein
VHVHECFTNQRRACGGGRGESGLWLDKGMRLGSGLGAPDVVDVRGGGDRVYMIRDWETYERCE